MQPPRQRIEPEKRPVQLREEQQIEIAAGYVSPLVSQYRPLRQCGPVDAIQWQHYAAADRHRRGDRSAGANAAAFRPGVANGPRRAHEVPGQNDAHQQASKHCSGHDEITSHQPKPPRRFAVDRYRDRRCRAVDGDGTHDRTFAAGEIGKRHWKIDRHGDGQQRVALEYGHGERGQEHRRPGGEQELNVAHAQNPQSELDQ